MLVIAPKYVVVNHMKTAVEVAQIETVSIPYNKQLKPGEQKEWFWQDHTKDKFLVVRKLGYKDYGATSPSHSSSSDASLSDEESKMYDKSTGSMR